MGQQVSGPYKDTRKEAQDALLQIIQTTYDKHAIMTKHHEQYDSYYVIHYSYMGQRYGAIAKTISAPKLFYGDTTKRYYAYI